MKITDLLQNIFLACIVCAAVSSEGNNLDSSKIDLGGFLALDEGQIVKGLSNVDPSSNQGPYKHVWQQRLFMQLTFNALFYEKLKLLLTAECALSFSLRRYNDVPASLQPVFNFYPADAACSYAIGNVQKPWLEMTFGYFTYKYNTDARNLGEYMFRTGTYPQFMISSFEFPMARLLGFKISSYLFDKSFKNDLFFTSEINSWPLQDFSLSYITSYNLKNYCEIGAGIHFNHWLSVKEDYTTPKKSPLNRYYTPRTDTTCDTGYYTFRGIKIMGRASFNFKKLIPPLERICGAEDLKLYAEVAILGTKNYANHIITGDTLKDSLGNPLVDPLTGLPLLSNKHWIKDPRSYYDDITSRIPVMFGINVPTFKLLDVVSLEFEFWQGKFPSNSRVAENMDEQNLPIPFVPAAGSDEATWSKWKWSVYVSRSIGKHFAVTGLIARDHMRPITHHPGNRQDKGDFLTKNDHYWWVLRLKASF